jgi:maltose O-acetyltransferase
MIGQTILLQFVNKLFGLTPLTRWYRLRAQMLRIAGVDCARSARIVSSAVFVIKNLSIGEDTFIGHQVFIGGYAGSKITIGDNVDIAPRVVVNSGTHEIDMLGAHSAGALTGGEINIQDGAWIGANSTILSGVTIGRKAVIGAGSLVCHDIPDFTIAVGNPCRPIKKWDPETKTFMKIKE